VVAEKLHHFRDHVLHPHIIEEEAASMVYVYYLDYCRAYPRFFVSHCNTTTTATTSSSLDNHLGQTGFSSPIPNKMKEENEDNNDDDGDEEET
jgi:hypothetical protein